MPRFTATMYRADHKKGGWFSLSEKSFERHIDYHVSMHLKDVVKQLDSFLSGEYVGRLLIGGSEEAVTKVKVCFHIPWQRRLSELSRQT